MKKRFSRKAFEAWLKEKPEAPAGGINACPLAEFSKETDTPLNSMSAKYDGPRWRFRFASALDQTTPQKWTKITRAQALKILRGIK